MANARGLRLRACNSLLHAALISQLLATVLGNSKGPMTTFELQTNLVSCGTEAAPPAAASSIAVCSPPESKLFGNVKIVSGTPHPGSTGVRGRLYDVGKLCDAKVADKIDRAWIAFLDCDGCALSTKLANLQSSNPQAILIYNQTSCVFPSPPPAPAGTPGASPLPATTTTSPGSAPPRSDAASPSAPPPPPALSSSPASFTTTQVPNPASTPPADSNNNNGGGQHDTGDGDDSGHHPDDDGSKEDPGEGDDENKASLQLIRRVQDDAPAPKRLLPWLLLARRRDDDNIVARTAEAVDPSESVIKYGTTVAMAEQVTIDYLFQVLLGPASFAPLPAALRTLKPIVRQHEDTAAAPAAANIKMAGATSTITDLMVSISPSIAEPVAPEPKFVSMSKPIFAAVIGALCAVVCGVVLVYVARPREGDDDKAFHFSDFKRGNSNSGFRSQGDLVGYPQRPIPIPVHGDEKYRGASFEDSNQALPAVYPPLPEGNSAVRREPGLGHPELTDAADDDDDDLQAQRQLRQLRQDASISPDHYEQEGYVPAASLMRSRSANFTQDEPQSGLPAWRQSHLVGSSTTSQPPPPQLSSLRMPRSWASQDNINSNMNDAPCLSAASSRNGGGLFHSPTTRKLPPPLPPMIETNLNHSSSSTKEGGLATSLYRQRMMAHHDTRSPIDSPSSLSSSVKKSPWGDITSANSFGRAGSTARSSTHDLVGPTRRDSLDQQHRRDIQLRFQEITGSSRSAASASASACASASARSDGTPSIPRASFSDDFAADSRRPSLELLRARHAAGS
ncbi:hypothetical protein KVV02_002838 [Mortierella alpina]|uniref:Uncharacterized protein n=1 Tax=Mortierella alpina TaxID=64518 RepID=A0A9P8D0U0_MORAP|nr:hypothetical protein KVV02_002838 [Mortierella alpina]